jgi:hypothetical protein
VTPELAIPLILSLQTLFHDQPLRYGPSFTAINREQLIADYMTKAWGGLPGMTPRDTPALQQRELATLPWFEFVGRHPELRHPFRPRGGR